MILHFKQQCVDLGSEYTEYLARDTWLLLIQIPGCSCWSPAAFYLNRSLPLEPLPYLCQSQKSRWSQVTQLLAAARVPSTT